MEYFPSGVGRFGYAMFTFSGLECVQSRHHHRPGYATKERLFHGWMMFVRSHQQRFALSLGAEEAQGSGCFLVKVLWYDIFFSCGASAIRWCDYKFDISRARSGGTRREQDQSCAEIDADDGNHKRGFPKENGECSRFVRTILGYPRKGWILHRRETHFLVRCNWSRVIPMPWPFARNFYGKYRRTLDLDFITPLPVVVVGGAFAGCCSHLNQSCQFETYWVNLVYNSLSSISSINIRSIHLSTMIVDHQYTWTTELHINRIK